MHPFFFISKKGGGMKSYLRFIEKLSKIMNVIAGTALTLIMLLTVADVALRYLGMPIVGTFEIVGLGGAIVVGFGIPAIIKLGYDPLWFGILISITVMMGVAIPPMAICVFVVKQITKTPFNVVYAGVYPFLISLLAGGIIVFIFPGMFPGIATWLPSVLMPGG